MRLVTFAVLTGTFALAAVGSLVAAGFAVTQVEDASEIGIRTALDKADLDWAEVQANGLQAILSGTAPNEAQRFRAKTAASTVVDASRVIDDMNVEARTALSPPHFSIEILRNDSDISLIGLIPAEMDREALLRSIARLRGVSEVSDLLQTADYPVPRGWKDTIAFAVAALNDLPRSKVSISANEVAITAMSESIPEKRQLESSLKAKAGPDIRLTTEISAPRPIIAPFTLRYVSDAGGARFDACSVDTEAARSQILAAARDSGLPEGTTPRCTIGLGVPSSEWGRATALAIRAVGKLGGGSVTFSDADISLLALEGTSQSTFDEVLGELENRLPDVYALHAVLPETPDRDEEEGPPEFIATLSPEGLVQLRGRISDEVMRNAAEALAKARFGAERVYTSARLDEDLPEGWSLRVLTALDALSRLSNGAVTVTPSSVGIRGNTGDQNANADIARLFGDKLGQTADFDIDVTYHEKLDPVAALPSPAECISQINALQEDAKINFDPGSTNVETGSRKILDSIAEVLKTCPELPLEIAGYTDSQGREEMNLALSKNRAQTILDELRMRRVLTRTFQADGFGEDDPIADNGTAEGREANRRIEFRLITEAPAEDASAQGDGEGDGDGGGEDPAAEEADNGSGAEDEPVEGAGDDTVSEEAGPEETGPEETGNIEEGSGDE
ncbi:OmpA family protein [Pseudooceanicola algae]|uniref:Peptidoglycan-associated lipoprotein n=1 Tax=Pseudooceanicola algae TaxID=1537215 RepID=A0A418SKP3_9RHOB|nr:OmpA family protein [Pseudooceanicola algae]QPM90730.1 Peptidoglycan-associated lipoprotein [Pseudooceanicola algae]